MRLDRLSKRVRCRLKTLTHFGEFARRQVDALLLYFRALVVRIGAPVLVVGAILQRLQFRRHLLHGLSELGDLSGDGRYVIRTRRRAPDPAR
jgi:hypothetical protein